MGRRKQQAEDPGRRPAQSFPVGNHVIFYRLLDGVVEIVNVIHGSRDIESLFGRQDP